MILNAAREEVPQEVSIISLEVRINFTSNFIIPEIFIMMKKITHLSAGV